MPQIGVIGPQADGMTQKNGGAGGIIRVDAEAGEARGVDRLVRPGAVGAFERRAGGGVAALVMQRDAEEVMGIRIIGAGRENGTVIGLGRAGVAGAVMGEALVEKCCGVCHRLIMARQY